MRTKTALAALVIVLVAVSSPADDPATNRGIALDSLYHVHDIDSVGLFNGNLMVAIPMGAEFQLDGGFSYSIQLIHTGKPFDFTFQERVLCDFVPLPPDCHPTHAVPKLNPRSNAGLGWRVSMG